jgi:Tfp pilus assembly major pilin PilA
MKSDKKYFVFIFLLILNNPLKSQDLEYLPPVLNKKSYNDGSLSFLLNTMTNNYEDKYKGKPFLNSVQIVDADQPWPPRWYCATPVYTYYDYKKDSAISQWQFNFMIDAKIDAGYFSFFKLISLLNDNGYIKKDVQGYIMLDKSMNPVDTVVSSTPNTYPYWHDFRINEKGERLMDIKVNKLLDLRQATGNPGDSAIGSSIDVIQILDSNNQVTFSWVSTDELDPNVFQFKESLKAKSFAATKDDGEFINWSHLTSAIWDYDGNILFSLRFIGIGKIDRANGHVIWKVDYKDLPIIQGNDTIMWEFPHDFEMISHNDTSALYSLYSLGSNEYPHARAILFEINKKTNAIKLVKYIFPTKDYQGEGQGSFDFFNDNEYLFCHGFYKYNDEVGDFVDAAEYTKKNAVQTVLQLPKNIQAYQVHKLENWPRPPRPEIILKKGRLEVKGEDKEWTWYELSGKDLTEIIPLGTCKSIVAGKRKTYCAAGRYGIGFVVSKPFSN